MPLLISQYPRGAEWRQWDLHIHTPASFHWLGQRFDSNPDSATNIALVDEMIEALNSAVPDVFSLMDYWTFDGWFALKRRLAQPGGSQTIKEGVSGHRVATNGTNGWAFECTCLIFR